MPLMVPRKEFRFQRHYRLDRVHFTAPDTYFIFDIQYDNYDINLIVPETRNPSLASLFFFFFFQLTTIF